MRLPSPPIAPIAVVLAVILAVGLANGANGQSQEPKPPLPATPVASGDAAPALPTTGVVGDAWEGPEFGVRLHWDAGTWTVEGENIEPGYDGLQLGTPRSTVFIEAYEGYDGDAEACLADAEAEIAVREGTVEVTPLEGRPLPTAEDVRGPAQLFGVTVTLADGSPFRALEYVECRTLAPGLSVVEITWQTPANAFNDEFLLVESLLATLELQSVATPTAPPLATPVA